MGINIGGHIIYTPVEDILNLLKVELADRGKIRFEKINRTGEQIMTNCPFHNGGRERKPSFGISEIGECHCFACGWATTDFTKFVSALLGVEDDGTYGRTWLLGRMAGATESKRDIQLTFNRYDTHKREKTIISEEELDKYRYTHPYMYTRHLNDRIIDFFDVGFDADRNCLTFPVKDIDGDVIFVATRSVSGKFFTLPSEIEKPVYGAYLFTTGVYEEAVIVESILNALTCWKYNIPAVALMGTGSKSQYEILKRLPVKRYILGLDSDSAGEAGCKRLKQALLGYKLLYKYHIPEGKDINDLDQGVLYLNKSFV